MTHHMIIYYNTRYVCVISNTLYCPQDICSYERMVKAPSCHRLKHTKGAKWLNCYINMHVTLNLTTDSPVPLV